MNFNFELFSPNITSFRASKVSNFEWELEIEPYEEGGQNAFAHGLIRPPSQPKRLVVERGFCADDAVGALKKLYGVFQEQPLTIRVFDRSHQNELKNYMVEGWRVVKISLSDLDAVQGAVWIETIEILYQTLREGAGAK